SAISNETPSTAVTAPYDLRRSSTTTAGMSVPLVPGRRDRQARVVAQVLGGRHEVRHQLGGELLTVGQLGAGRLDGGRHVGEPAISFEGTDVERHVAHPQPRVPALVVVGLGTAPVLDEEQRQ